jgi:hypothetical protein
MRSCAASGRPPLAEHTYLVISNILDSEGKEGILGGENSQRTAFRPDGILGGPPSKTNRFLAIIILSNSLCPGLAAQDRAVRNLLSDEGRILNPDNPVAERLLGSDFLSSVHTIRHESGGRMFIMVCDSATQAERLAELCVRTAAAARSGW